MKSYFSIITHIKLYKTEIIKMQANEHNWRCKHTHNINGIISVSISYQK